MRKCDFCKNECNCSSVERKSCYENDWSNYAPEQTADSHLVDIRDVVSSILELTTWLDGACLVVARDAVLDAVKHIYKK